MKRSSIILGLIFFFLKSVNGQNIASVEAPMGISFVYGLDHNPVLYTQLKANVGVAWGEGMFAGKWHSWAYDFAVEQRYKCQQLGTRGKHVFRVWL